MKKELYYTSFIIIAFIGTLFILPSCSFTGDENRNSMYTSEIEGTDGLGNGELYSGNVASFEGHINPTSSNANITDYADMLTGLSDSKSTETLERSKNEIDFIQTTSTSSTKVATNYSIGQLDGELISNAVDSKQTSALIAVNEAPKSKKGQATVDAKAASRNGPQGIKPSGPSGPSLPLGDGTWMLMMFMAAYSIYKVLKMQKATAKM